MKPLGLGVGFMNPICSGLELQLFDALWTGPFQRDKVPRGSISSTIMELGPRRPSPVWGPNSIIVVYMDPLG